MFKNQSVLLLIDDFLLQEGLYSFLSINLGFKTVVSCSEIKDFEQKVVSLQPNYIVVTSHSKVFKIEKVIAFVSITAQSQLIVMGVPLEKSEFEKIKQLGVSGFLLNEVGQDELLLCFKKVSQKQVYCSKKFYFEADAIHTTNIFQDLNISEREVEIIKLIAQGLINKEIADRLFLSTHTVNTHRKNIMQKLGINNTAGIVLFAVKEKIVSPNEFLFQ